MDNIKLTIALIVSVLLQWTLRNVAEPLAFVDFPLIVIVYAALQRDAIKAVLFGSIAGLAVDALSGGLLGANGFAKTLVAFAVSELARRVYMDNLLLRIPVIAAASMIDDLVYYGLHRLLGQSRMFRSSPRSLTRSSGRRSLARSFTFFLEFALSQKMRETQTGQFLGAPGISPPYPIR